MNSVIIRTRSPYALTLNESIDENGNKRYIFTGPFTPCDGTTKNRNERIYDEEEVLPHLAYLRDMIKKTGCIIGELDHPDGRFEICLKEASHKIIDLWYDPDTKTVMGKLELLDTPNGKIVKALVDGGCPVFVSSRAAGTVGPDSHVHIQQIFTYDIVATPGFEECELSRVNENMRARVNNYLNESLNISKKAKNMNVAGKYGINNSNTEIYESTIIPKITFKKDNMKIKNKESLAIPIHGKVKHDMISEDIKVKLTPQKAQELNVNKAQSDQPVQHTPESIMSIRPVYKEEGSNAIKDIQPQFSTVPQSDDDNTIGTAQNRPVSESMLARMKVLKQQHNGKNSAKNKLKEDETVPIDKTETIDSDVKTAVPDSSDGDTEYSKKEDISELDKKENICPYCGNPVSKCTCVKKIKNHRKDIDEGTDHIIEKYNALFEQKQRKAKVRGSIIARFPFSVSLSESNFDKFASLLDEDKKICANYIWTNQIFDIKSINEQWMTPMNERKKMQSAYLRLADSEDIDLYRKSPENIRHSIDEMAKYYVIENKEDADEFWARTGLREQAIAKIKNKEFINSYNESMKGAVDNPDEPYGFKIVRLTESMLNELK